MFKNAVGIIVGKASKYWIVEILRSADAQKARRRNIQTKLYFDNFNFNISDINKSFELKDSIRFEYRKIYHNGNLKIVVNSVKKLESQTLTGDLGVKTTPKDKLPVIVVETDDVIDVYIAWNLSATKLAKNRSRHVAIKYVELDHNEFGVDLNTFTNTPYVHYHLVCVVKLYMQRVDSTTYTDIYTDTIDHQTTATDHTANNTVIDTKNDTKNDTDNVSASSQWELMIEQKSESNIVSQYGEDNHTENGSTYSYHDPEPKSKPKPKSKSKSEPKSELKLEPKSEPKMDILDPILMTNMNGFVNCMIHQQTKTNNPSIETAPFYGSNRITGKNRIDRHNRINDTFKANST